MSGINFLTRWERAFDAGVVQAGLVFAKLVLGQVDVTVANDVKRKALMALTVAAQAGIADAQWLLAQTKRGEAANPHHLDSPPDSVNASTPSGEEASHPMSWTSRAAGGGVIQAQYALTENAWIRLDWDTFLRWALPLARSLVRQADAAAQTLQSPAWRMAKEEVVLLTRCAQLLSKMEQKQVAADEIQQFWELAAQHDEREAQLWLGLWFARMDADGVRVAAGSGSANFKKAIRWLKLAGEQGLAEAWYALSRIYLKPEFSQRNVIDAQQYLERAAQLGHCAAQLECGNNAWRSRRDDEMNDVRAVFWLQKASAQGSAEASALLEKIAPPAGPAKWAEAAQQCMTREKINSYPFLAARIELAILFRLSRAEALLLEINAADQGHCLVVDIRAHYGRNKRRLILLQTAQERHALDRIARLFVDVDCGLTGPEGNYRQRLYRFKTVLPNLADAGADIQH